MEMALNLDHVSPQISNPLSSLPNEIAETILLPLFIHSFTSLHILSMVSKDSESLSKRVIRKYNHLVKLHSSFAYQDLAIKYAVQYQLREINLEGPWSFKDPPEEKSASFPNFRRSILRMVNIVSLGNFGIHPVERDVLLPLVNHSTLKRISIINCQLLTDEMFWCFKQIIGLEEIYLVNCQGLGGKIIQYIGGNVSLTSLTFSMCENLKDEYFSHFKTLTRLKNLDLTSCKYVTDKGVKNFASLPSLKRLDITSCTGLFVACRKWLTNLEALTANLPDECLSSFQEHTNLQELTLNCSLFTGKGLFCIRNLPRLKSLDILRSNLTEEGVKNIIYLTQLESLSIRLNDRCLKYIRDLTNLKKLDLSHSILTGEGIPYLTTLSNLKILNLYACSELKNDWHSSIQKFPNLRALFFQLNELTGSFPEAFSGKGIVVIPGRDVTKEQVDQFKKLCE